MIEQGFYEGELIDAVLSTPEGKSPSMVLTFKVGDYRRNVFLYLSEKAYEFSIEKLQRLGFNGDFEKPEFSTTKCELECVHEQYEGKLKEKWNIAGGFKAEAAPPDVAKQFSARYRATTGAPPPKPAGKPAAPPSASASTPAKAPPPPATSAPAAKPKKPYGKDEAWESFTNDHGNDVEKWQERIAEACGKFGKADETQFGEAEWSFVGGIPF